MNYDSASTYISEDVKRTGRVMTRQEAIEDLKLLRFNHNVMINGTNHTSKALDIAIEALELIETKQQAIKASDPIDRQAALDICNNAIDLWEGQIGEGALIAVKDKIAELPSAKPERKKGERMSNREWVDFLSEQFNVSRTSAREMLHGLMKWKVEDNFKKQFSGGRNEKE